MAPRGSLPRLKTVACLAVEQCGRSETLFSSLYHSLSFLELVHEFDPHEGILGCLERFEPQHGPGHSL
jgi:hypothetical protein